jgi:hypothetical protein
MFAQEEDGVQHFGENEYFFDSEDGVFIGDLEKKIRKAYRESVKAGDSVVEGFSEDEFVEIFNPDDIVDSANAWDDKEALAWFRENIVEVYDIPAITTYDGAVVFDESVLRNTREKDQTKTPAFKKFFGDSQAVDENGKPLAVYHGTNAEFDTFDLSKSKRSLAGKGFYFIDSSANDFGNIQMPVYLSIQNPYRIDFENRQQIEFILKDILGYKDVSDISWLGTRKALNEVMRQEQFDNAGEFRKWLKNNGYDGVITQDVYKNNETIFVALDPTQIKSATDNNGNFDPNDPNIYHQEQQPVNLAISESVKAKIEELSKLEAGKNLFDDKFDDWLRKTLTEEENNRIDNNDLDYYVHEMGEPSLDEANEEIEDDIEDGTNNNDYDRDALFSEAEYLEYLKEKDRKNVGGSVRETIRTADAYDFERWRQEYEDHDERDFLFDEYVDLVNEIMKDNGFLTDSDSSRISDSRYVNVYRTQDDLDSGSYFAAIRISDHDTHKFYGNHINLYTTKSIQGEIDKLVRAFSEGRFGVDETVYHQKINGYFDPTNKFRQIIGIMQTGDLETALHELNHFFAINYIQMAIDTGQLDKIKGLMNHYGVKDAKQLFNGDIQEDLARRFALYVKTDETPRGLRPYFDKLRDWLIQAWDRLVNIGQVNPDEIPEPIRDFFDTLTKLKPENVDLEHIRQNKPAIRQLLKDIRAGKKVKIGNIDLKEVEGLIKAANARIPRAPKTLFDDLRGKLNRKWAERFDIPAILGLDDNPTAMGHYFAKAGGIAKEDAFIEWMANNGYLNGQTDMESDARAVSEEWDEVIGMVGKARETHNLENGVKAERIRQLGQMKDEAAQILSEVDVYDALAAIEALKSKNLAVVQKEEIDRAKRRLDAMESDYRRLARKMARQKAAEVDSAKKSAVNFLMEQDLPEDVKNRFFRKINSVKDIRTLSEYMQDVRENANRYYSGIAARNLSDAIQSEVKETFARNKKAQKYD